MILFNSLLGVGGKGAHTLAEGRGKVNVIALLEFELANFEAGVQHFIPLGFPPKRFWRTLVELYLNHCKRFLSISFFKTHVSAYIQGVSKGWL